MRKNQSNHMDPSHQTNETNEEMLDQTEILEIKGKEKTDDSKSVEHKVDNVDVDRYYVFFFIHLIKITFESVFKELIVQRQGARRG